MLTGRGRTGQVPWETLSASRLCSVVGGEGSRRLGSSPAFPGEGRALHLSPGAASVQCFPPPDCVSEADSLVLITWRFYG